MKEELIPKNGDQYWAYMMSPTITLPTKVTVTRENISGDSISCDLDYDVEDEKGRRLWNSYTVVNYSDRVVEGEDRTSYHVRKMKEWVSEGYNFKIDKWETP